MDKDRIVGQRHQKKNKYHLKVIDFSVWNGIKFGIGLAIGTVVGYVIMMIIGMIAATLLTKFLGPLPPMPI